MLVLCPHCGQMADIIELNCAIFRCGIYKLTFLQISPHLPKDECDRLAANQLIYGCGKPFMVVHGKAMLCSYI
jgi:hypothetical protein